MTTILGYYKYAALAAASYVRVGPDVVPLPAPNQPAVLGARFASEANRQDRLPLVLGQYLFDPQPERPNPNFWTIKHYYGGDVPASQDPRAAQDKSGFGATLFQNFQTGETVLAMRGTEPSEEGILGIPGTGIDLLSADLGQIGIFGIALTQVVSMANYVMRLRAGTNVMVPQIMVEATLAQPAEGPYLTAQGSTLGVSTPVYLKFSAAPSASGLGELVQTETAVKLTGHSLGGHLAVMAARLFPDVFDSDVVVFNAPGYDPTTANLLELIEKTLPLPNVDTGRIMKLRMVPELGLAATLLDTHANLLSTEALNKINQALRPGSGIVQGNPTVLSLRSEDLAPGDDLSIVASELTGADKYGQPIDLPTEENNHVIEPFMDALALQAAIEPMQKDQFGTIELTRVLQSSSNDNARSYEGFTEGLFRLFLKDQAFRRADDKLDRASLPTSDEFSLFNVGKGSIDARNAFHDAVLRIHDASKNKTGLQLFSLANISATDLTAVSQGSEAMGYRYALKNLNPFVILGDNSIYGVHNVSGRIDLYDSATGNGLTQDYLTDRSEMLVSWVARNIADVRILNFGTSPATDYTDRRVILVSGDEGTREAFVEEKVLVGGGLVRLGVRQVAFGSDRVDEFKGSGFADRLYGGGGADKLVGFGGVDYLQGDQGNDMLEGGVGNDVLDGGYGRDTYLWNLGDGSDMIRDDDGKGFLIVNGSAPGVALASGGNTWISADGKLTLTRNSPLTIHTEDGGEIVLENFQDGDFGIRLRSLPADESTTRTILGDLEPIDFDPATPGVQTQVDDLGNVVTDPNGSVPNRADTLSGSVGADLIQSGGGNDTVRAGAGGDQVQVGPGRDIVHGEAGNDLLEGGPAGDILSGGDGEDRLYAGARGTDALTDISSAIAAGSGPGTALQGDWLAGGAGDDILIGGADNDALTGGEGVDLLIGGAGADNLLGDSSYVATSLTWTFADSAGQRLFSPVVGEANPLEGAADEIYAGAGNDFIRGGRGDDVIYGEGDQDDIAGEQGADVIFGGDGNDSLSGDASYIAGAEHGADYLDGGAGNDQIAGEGGEDVIFGGAGTDVILGDGAGLDAAFHGADFIDGGDDNDVINAGGGDDILAGGQGADVLVGSTGNDQLEGGIGADILSGGEGDDRYVADAADTIEDDLGANTIVLAEGETPGGWVLHETVIGGQPAAVLSLAGQAPGTGAPAGLTITGRLDRFTFEFANGEVLSSGELVYRTATEGRAVRGTAADEVLIGTRFNDRLEGFGGNDTLDGREGNDKLLGGDGDDVYLFDRDFGIDRIDEFVGFSTDTIRFGADITTAEVTVARRANGDLVLSLSPQDQVTIVGQYRDGSKIEQIEFGDGVALTLAELDALPVSPIVGTDGPDTLPGTEADDTIEGREGLDIYALGYGTGRDTFIDTDGRIVLQTGLGFDGLRALREGDDLALLIRGTTEGAILKDYYLSPQSWTIEDADGAQTTPQAIADATTAREQDWVNAQRDEYRYTLKSRAIERFVFPGSDVELVGDGVLELPWQRSHGALNVAGFGSWTTDAITTTIYAANGTVSVLPSFFSDDAWSMISTPSVLDFHVAIVNDTIISDDEFIFSTAGRSREEEFELVVATVAWDRASADQRAEYTTTTTTQLLFGGAYATSTARHSSFSGLVDGRVIAIAPVGSVTLSSGLFPEHVEAFLSTVHETWRITDIVAGPGDNTIFGEGMDVIDAGDGNDTASGGFVYGGSGDDVISGEIAIGGPGNDTIQGDVLHGGAGDDYLEGFGASRFLFDADDQGRDTVTDSQGLSVQQLAGWYYPSIDIPDWRDRLFDPEEDRTISIGEAIVRGLLPPLPQIAAHDWSALAPLYAAGVIEVDAVEFRQGLVATDLSLSWDEMTSYSPVSGALEAYAILDVSWGVGNLARILIPHAEDPLGTGVEEFRFDDGSVLSMQEMVAAAPPAPSFDPQFGDNVLVGTALGEAIDGRAGNDAIFGQGGDDSLFGEEGNDTLTGGPGGDFAQGGLGDDVYVFAQGDGADQVFEEGGVDAVRFSGDIAPEDVLVTTNSGGALILTLATSDRLTILDWFNETTRVESVEFADGTIWDTAELISRITVTPATELDDIITGTPAEDVIDGLDGNDWINGFGGDDVLEGSAGDDFLEGGAGGDILRGGEGADYLSDWEGNNFLEGGTGDDFISATGSDADGGSNFILGVAGNDVINSYAAGNVIAFNPGDGHDTIHAGNSLTLSLGGGIDPAALSLSQDGADLVLAISASDSIRLTRQFEPDPEAWPQITLQMFGSVHIYDFSAVIDEFQQALAADPLLAEFPLDGVLQAHQTGFSETHALGGPLAYQYGTLGDLNALSDAVMREALGDANFGMAPQAIEVEAANQPPLLVNTIEDQTATEDAAFAFNVPVNSFADADAEDVLTYSASLANDDLLPSWLTFDAAARTFTGMPANDDVGAFDVTVTATDIGGASAFDTFHVTVANTNDAPVAGDDTGTASEDGGPVVLAGAALLANDSDVDAGDTESIVSVTGSAAGAQVTLVGADVVYDVGSLFQSLGEGAIATDALTYTMADAAGVTATANVAMTISGVNDAPVLDQPLADQSAIAGAAFSFTMAADAFSDIDEGDVLTYGASLMSGDLPAWLTFDAATRTFSGTPGATEVGTHSIVVSATDLAGARAVDEFQLTVAGDEECHGVHLIGTNGDDVLTGTPCDDVIDGGKGFDRMIGGAGDDTYFVDETRGDEDDDDDHEDSRDDDDDHDEDHEDHDHEQRIVDDVVENANEGSDTVFSSADFTLPANVENLVLTGDDELTGKGNALDNIIVGNAEDNRLAGGRGADIYVHEARGGDDVIEETGLDADTLLLGAGITPDMARLERRRDDLVVDLSGRNGSVTVKGWFDSDSKRVERIEFADGTVWGVEDIGERIKRKRSSSGHGRDDDHDEGHHQDRDDHHGKSDGREREDRDDDRSERKPDRVGDLLEAYLARKPQYDFDALAQELERPEQRGEVLDAQEIARRWQAVARFANGLANEHDEEARGGAAYRFNEHGLLGGGALGGGFGYTGSTGTARGPASLRTLQGLEEGFQRIQS